MTTPAETVGSIPYSGLTLTQIPRLAQAIKDHFGPRWTLQPWLGRLGYRVLLTGPGAQLHREKDCASAALMRVFAVEEGSADLRILCRKIEAALRLSTELPNPYQHLSSYGLLVGLVRASLDARARTRGIAWQHPDGGTLLCQPRLGWMASSQRPAELVTLIHEPGWVELEELPHQALPFVCSTEQWILHAILRWRDQAPVFPPELHLKLSAFPDIAAVSGQPRLLHALLTLQEGRTLAEVVHLTGCPARLVDALVLALAVSGLVQDFDLQAKTRAVPAPVAAATEGAAFPALRRIAHFLGIGRAVGW
ncbi:MAG: hypothetical protein MUE46_16445 [Xanthomonadales bacterium]|jgi:hypothetical protein|nr:hypothetical protein [Xanthomonadales bacterium]